MDIEDRQGSSECSVNRVERKMLYTMIVRLRRRRAGLLANAAVTAIERIKNLVKTITFDNGLEFSDHETIAAGLDAVIS